jgi:hypothetical protein
MNLGLSLGTLRYSCWGPATPLSLPSSRWGGLGLGLGLGLWWGIIYKIEGGLVRFYFLRCNFPIWC